MATQHPEQNLRLSFNAALSEEYIKRLKISVMLEANYQVTDLCRLLPVMFCLDTTVADSLKWKYMDVVRA